MEEVEVTLSPASSPQEDVEVDEGEDYTAEVQPDFTAQEVEVEEVTIIETEEVTEITEVTVTDETMRDQEDLDTHEGKAAENARAKVLPGEDLQTAISLESGLGIDPLNKKSGPNSGVHEDKTPGRKAGKLSRQLEDTTDDEVHHVVAVSDVVLLPGAIQEATILTASTCVNEDGNFSGEVVLGNSADVKEMHGGKLLTQNLNELEADPQEESIEPGQGQAAISDKHEEVTDPGKIGGCQPKEVAANPKHKLASTDGVVREMGSESPLVGREAGALNIDSLPVELSIQTGEINNGGSGSGRELSLEAEALVQSPTSTENAITENRLGSVQQSPEPELWSAPPSVAYFSDAQQAQLRSQILVLGDLR